jgi:hypothetical protein
VPSRDNCLITSCFAGGQSGLDVARAISHFGRLFTDCQKTPGKKRIESCGVGKKSWSASNLHWTFGTGKKKPKLGHGKGDCRGIGFEPDRDNRRSRKRLEVMIFEFGVDAKTKETEII